MTSVELKFRVSSKQIKISSTYINEGTLYFKITKQKSWINRYRWNPKFNGIAKTLKVIVGRHSLIKPKKLGDIFNPKPQQYSNINPHQYMLIFLE